MICFRLEDFLNDLLFAYENGSKSILVVSHKGPIRALVCLLLDHSTLIHNVQSTDVPIVYNSVSHFKLNICDNLVQNCQVVKLFDCSHLE